MEKKNDVELVKELFEIVILIWSQDIIRNTISE